MEHWRDAYQRPPPCSTLRECRHAEEELESCLGPSPCGAATLVPLCLLLPVLVLGGQPVARRRAAPAERRLHPRRRPRLGGPRVLRQHVLRDAEPRPAGVAGGAVHAGLRRLPGLLADAGQHPDRQVSRPAAPDRLAARPPGHADAEAPPAGDHRRTCRSRRSRSPRPSSRPATPPASSASGTWAAPAFYPSSRASTSTSAGCEPGHPPAISARTRSRRSPTARRAST